MARNGKGPVAARVRARIAAKAKGINRKVEKEAKGATKEVCDRIIATIKGHTHSSARDLAATMYDAYLPGFIAAIQENENFWKDYRLKVLRMATYAASFACYLVERTRPFLSAREREEYVVTEDEWRMGMAIVRSACLAGGDGHRGLPCARQNFQLSAKTKADVILTFAEISADLMTDDPY